MFLLSPSQSLGKFSYADGPGFTVAVRYLYPVDLDADGADELIFAGFETQPNTPANYTNTRVTIFGWKQGVFTNLTAQWLPAGADRVEGVGDIGFGDFNGDGRLDAFLSGYADMAHRLNSYVLLNRGAHLEKVMVEAGVIGWQHGVAVGDINRDGFDDVYATGYDDAMRLYLGGPQGFSIAAVQHFGGGSGVALGDFLADGSTAMVLVDHLARDGKDTALYRLQGSALQYSLEFVSALPIARIDLPQFGVTTDPWGQSHDVRARAFDFSGDGLLDVLVFSRRSFDGKEWPEISQIQFLKNLGGGRFADVTDSQVAGYKTESAVTYTPVFIDMNDDGRTDLFVSEATFTRDHDSTAVLIQQSDRTFIDTGRNEFSARVADFNGIASVVRGPGSRKYLVAERQDIGGEATVTMSEILLASGIGTSLKATEGQAFQANLLKTAWALAPKQARLSFSSDELPAWLKLDARKGVLSGTPDYTAADAGARVIRIEASDADGATTAVALSLVVDNAPRVTGSRKADRLAAGNGDDVLVGGAGNDTLSGGAGTDIFVFDRPPGRSNLDLITDFAGDKLRLEPKAFAALKQGFSAENFVIGNPQDASDVIAYRNGTLYYDPDGAGARAAVAIVQLAGAPALDFSAFHPEAATLF